MRMKQLLGLKKHVKEEMEKVKLEECSASRQEDKKKIMEEIGLHVPEVESILAHAAKVSYKKAKKLARTTKSTSDSDLSPSSSSDSLPAGGKTVTEACDEYELV